MDLANIENIPVWRPGNLQILEITLIWEPEMLEILEIFPDLSPGVSEILKVVSFYQLLSISSRARRDRVARMGRMERLDGQARWTVGLLHCSPLVLPRRIS